MTTRVKKTAILLLTCPDRKGLVAAISNFLYKHGANILHADQHQDSDTGLFLMRVEWDLAEWTLSNQTWEEKFKPVAKEYNMHWHLAFSSILPNIAIFVSKFDHCLADLLYRNRIGELNCRIALVISNHSETRRLTEFYNVPFHEIAMESKSKEEAEKLQLALLKEYAINLIVLARYMQILSASFIHEHPNRIINIHHSFLPAFLGAKPYHQAYSKGVKLIGATSHYVTEQLDDGPIIDQDVIRISHRDQVSDLIQKGRDLERQVLSRAVKWHLENRVIVCGKKTVIFD